MTSGTPQFVAIGIVLILLSSFGLHGQELLSPTQTKGTHDVELWTGALVAQHDGSTTFNTDVWMAGARFGHVLTTQHASGWLRGTLEWNFDVIPALVFTNLQTTYGAEFDPIVLRWNFTHKGRFAPSYFETAGGIAYTISKVPPGDTSRWNVVPKVGVGWQIFRGEQRSIDLEIRAWHLSNAWTAPRNPSSNGILFSIGYHWYRMKNSPAAGRAGENQPAGVHD
jgi:hypothetical protein